MPSEQGTVTARRALDDAIKGMIDDLFPRLAAEEREKIRVGMWRVIRETVAAADREGPTDAND